MQEHPEESAHIIASKLEAFDQVLQTRLDALETKTRRNGKDAAVLQARENSPGIYHNEKFRLLFLRCEVLSVGLAVTRFVRYWDATLDLFGPEKSFLPMNLHGAYADDVSEISRGYIRAVPGHERVALISVSLIPATIENVDSLVRAYLYGIYRILLNSNEAQRKGLILIVDVSQPQGFCKKFVTRLVKSLTGVFPSRVSTMVLYNVHSWMDAVMRVFFLVFPPKIRQRIRTATDAATLEEWTGVSAVDLEASAKQHHQWVDHMKVLEREPDSMRCQ